VIFSIFGRKEKAPARRRDGDPPTQRGGPVTGSDSITASTTVVDQREIARRTAEKIDLIESQMDLAMTQKPAAHAGERSRLSLVTSRDPKPVPIVPELRTAKPADVLSCVLLPTFEEAALLFSNSQSDEAAMMLWQAIKEDQLGEHSRQAWTMLFELYQASGRRPEFESLAIAYASRSERSPPAWSDDLGPPAAKLAQALTASTIVFPVALDAGALKQIEQMRRAAHRNRPAEVDFSRVASVDVVGAGLLLEVLVDFRSNARQLTLAGVEALQVAVSRVIENGRRDASDACWLLKLETMRFLGEQAQFEDLAIDYCVTYEVSPPSWEALPDSIRLGKRAAAPAGGASPTVSAGQAPDEPGIGSEEAFALEGEIDGRPEALFKSLRDHARGREEIVIDCRRLRRVNFAFAGEILNEATALRSAGKSLVFKDLSCLVACLMMVMGMQELADLNLRIR
jgi:anti-anti-sigma regulatory factor